MTFTLHAPQITMLILCALGCCGAGTSHGKPRENWNFYTTFFSILVEIAILYWGGFFKP